MTHLPPLSNWESTAHSLHQAAQLLGALRMLLIERQPNYVELPMQIVPAGLSTGQMPFDGEVILDFRQAALAYQIGSDLPSTIALAGHNQRSLFEALLTTLVDSAALELDHGGHASRVDAFYAALQANGHPLTPPIEEFTRDTPLTVDAQLSADYAAALYRIFTAASRFRARLMGPMTPIVVWPEHFDLSFLWFATAAFDENAAHMNFGFAPFSPDIPRPYLYAYAYPLPDGYGEPTLPAPAYWKTEPWTGVVVPYDDLVKFDDPEAEIESLYSDIYDALSPILNS